MYDVSDNSVCDEVPFFFSSKGITICLLFSGIIVSRDNLKQMVSPLNVGILIVFMFVMS